jgi:hypothetical protein
MIISPLKNAHKPPQVEAFQYGKLSDRQNTRGNSLSLVETEEGQFDLLEFPGQTQGRIVIFGTNTMTTTGADWPYTASDVLTISGCQITANNKTATVVSVSGKTMTFAASTFTPAVETQGSITDGTDVYQITVDPGHPQTLASQTSFDLTVRNADGSETITVTVPLRDTSNNQLQNRGIVATYNVDGSPSTFSVQCKIIKKTDGKWYLRNNIQKKIVVADNISALNTGLTNVDLVELSATFANDMTGYGTTDYYGLSISTTISSPRNNVAIDFSTSAWRHYTSTTKIIISVPKGTYANLAAAKAALTGIEVQYAIASTDTELSPADQTALNAAEVSFAGTTNIMLSTALGQVRVDQWSKAARR